jgi:hypothetical protein
MKKDVNPKLDADLTMVGELYATNNLTGTELDDAFEILRLIRAGSFGPAKKLCDTFVRPEFGTSHSYFVKKQFVSLLSKVPFRGSNQQRKDQAKADFFEAERRCKRVNRKLAWYSRHRARVPDNIRVVLERARNEIRRVLGPLNETVLDRLIKESRPGSGVAIGTWNKFRVSLPFKLGATDLSHTPGCKPYVPMLVEGSPVWFRLHAEIDWGKLEYHVPYVEAISNRITFVPKDARTLRTIAIEPALNVCLQLGVHSHLSRRLSKAGNSILYQSRNQNLAREASVLEFGRSYATIDLSQASDSVSFELVRWLLPSDWFTLLCDFRCETGVIDGETICYEKFSSMGNGYTFALETLLFRALGVASNSLSGGDVLSVYGDDIIISDRSALLLLEVLKWTGFVVNASKTFITGPFRESCGADWHSGDRVTPQYIRKAVLRSSDVYQLLNRLDPVLKVHPVRSYLLGCIRKVGKVLYGLENEDTSSCLFAPFDYVKGGGHLSWDFDIQNWKYKVIRFIPESPNTPSEWAYAAALRGGLGSNYSLRGRGEFRYRSVTAGCKIGVPVFGQQSPVEEPIEVRDDPRGIPWLAITWCGLPSP